MPTYTYMQAERPKASVADVQPQTVREPLLNERTGRYIEYALAAMTGFAGLFFVYELVVYFTQTH